MTSRRASAPTSMSPAVIALQWQDFASHWQKQYTGGASNVRGWQSTSCTNGTKKPKQTLVPTLGGTMSFLEGTIRVNDAGVEAVRGSTLNSRLKCSAW